MYKPFKPPLLKSVTRPVAPVDLTESDDESLSRPSKKRKLLVHVVEESPPRKAAPSSSASVLAPRKPLFVVKNPTELRPADESALECPEGYYMVLWRKFTAKKHKTWDGDGVLSVHGGYARLQDVSGRDMGRIMYKDPLLPGSTMSIGGKDVEIDSIISKADFMAGRPFLKTAPAKRTESSGSSSSPAHPLKVSVSLSKGKIPLLGPKKKKEELDEDGPIPTKSFYGKTNAMHAHFKNPLLSTTVMPQTEDGKPTPRHDPDAPGAVVMKRLKTCPKGKQIVDVVLDPFLGQHFRPHQREGVKFMYECVMGMREFNGKGVILADEMGLGKTLQTIALIWTLLKQNPIHDSGGVIKKALIVCPVTLINNWKKEFQKWLGNQRIGVFVADGQNIKLSDFTHGKSYSVMIIGYEKLRSVQEDLKKGGGIDIVIADEGHRLKTAKNKSAEAIKALNTDMRVILSGTPIQNDLSEFFVMVDFVNPGLLGPYKTFKKEFEIPILKSRQPDASKKDIEKGNAREEELSSLTKMFILRRTADVIAKFLPPKSEYVIFCKPTQAQTQVYHHVLESPLYGRVVRSSESALQLITMLKKVCNAPRLLASKDEDSTPNSNVAELLDLIPAELLKKSTTSSGTKFRVLGHLVKHLSEITDEKIVIVSNYTSTLDLLGQLLASHSLPFLRLDGSTPAGKRQDLVDSFNRAPASKSFAFLLSAKAGGTGLNLIGASRLVLFDVDWNPATDLQAMGRIHRDGQKRPVKIYRFLMAGGMDEKIYQRQVTKMGLADSVVDGKKNDSSFSQKQLRDMFRLDLDATCQTHDLLGCECNGTGSNLASNPTLEDLEASEIEAEIVESDDSDDDEESLPPLHLLMPGTKANIKELERKLSEEERETRAKKAKGKMQALCAYKHIDTSIFRGETKDVFDDDTDQIRGAKKALDDKVLVKVLEEHNCKINYVFLKGPKV